MARFSSLWSCPLSGHSAKKDPEGGRFFALCAKVRQGLFSSKPFLLYVIMTIIASEISFLLYNFRMPTPHKYALSPLAVSDKDIGMRLSAFRKAKGLTQIALASQMGITQHMISDYETGRRRMSVDMLIRFAFALEIPSDKIIGIEQGDILPALTTKLMRRLKQIESLPPERQKMVLKNLENLLDMAGSIA